MEALLFCIFIVVISGALICVAVVGVYTDAELAQWVFQTENGRCAFLVGMLAALTVCGGGVFVLVTCPSDNSLNHFNPYSGTKTCACFGSMGYA